MEQQTVYVLVEDDAFRRIQAVCATAEEAECMRQSLYHTVHERGRKKHRARMAIHAMTAMFPGDRHRLVYGTPQARPEHPLVVPRFSLSLLTNTDAHSEAFLYTDELFVHRKEALVAAARHNFQQLRQPPSASLDWAVVVEIGEPLRRRYRSECLVRHGLGWEETDLVRPVRVIYPTAEEVTFGGSAADAS